VSDRFQTGLRVELLSREHDQSEFACGRLELDAYIRERAGQDMKRHLATAFVLVDDSPVVIGYYTLSQLALSLDDLPEEIARRLPRYPLVPGTLIGRLAVDMRRQGGGLGELLLIDALLRAWRTSRSVASYAILVDAIDERARDFYLGYDFIPRPRDPLKLFLPMRTLDRLFSDMTV
jgi:hypothetical protein